MSIKISQMAEAGSLTGAEIIPGLQDGENVIMTAQEIANLAPGGGGSSNTRQVLEDGGTVVMALEEGNIGYVEIEDNRTLSITGMSGLAFGLVEVKHMVAGKLLALPGNADGVVWNEDLNGITLLGFYYNGTSFIWSSNLQGEAGDTPPALTALIWANNLNTANGTDGTINGTSGTPGGARCTLKIVGDGYVQFPVDSATTNSQALIMCLNNVDNTDYRWNYSPNTIIGGLFVAPGGNITALEVSTAGTTRNLGDSTLYTSLRIGRVGDDLVYSASSDGVSFSVIDTQAGLFTGITNTYIKVIFAINSTDKTLVNVKGLGLV